MTSLAIHTDRLKKTLEKNGVSWKRHKILELLSSTFGYHNSNELTAAHKRGEIDPPKAAPVGEIALPNGETIVIARDPLANASYGICRAFLEQLVAEERAETFGPTPYGHLVDLSRLLDEDIEKLTPALSRAASERTASVDVYCAVKTFRSGGEGVTAYLSEDDLYADCAYLCRSDWDRRSQMGDIPAGFDLETASDREIVEAYYQNSGLDDGETFAVHVVSLALPAPLASAASASTPRLDPNATIKLKLFQAEITHKHGTDIYLEASQEALSQRIAKYCRENWGEWLEFGEEGADDIDPETLSDEEVTRRYFAAMLGEYSEESTTEVEVPVGSLDLSGILAPNPSEKGINGRKSPKGPSKMPGKPGSTAKNPAPAPLPPEFKNHPFTIEQRDQILAALRLWQTIDMAQIPEEIRWIAEDERDECLSKDDIDQICDTLNHPGPSRPEASSDEGDPIQALINEHADGNSWGEHVDYPREDWRYEVDNNDTCLGYWEWLLHRLEDAENHPLESDEDDRIANAQVRPHHVLANALHLGDGSERPLYLTNATCEHAHGDPDLLKKHCLQWSLDGDGYFYPLTQVEAQYIADDTIEMPNGLSALMGYTCLYRGQKYVMPSIEVPFATDDDTNDAEMSRDDALGYVLAFANDLRPKIHKIGGHVLIEEDDGPGDRHTVQILIPFSYILRRSRFGQWSYDEWKAEVAELLHASQAPRILATFNPQAWMNDYAIGVDPEGETTWDVTGEILAMGREAAEALQDDRDPTDELRHSRNAPAWVRDWSGPFSVEIEDAIQAFYQHFDGDAEA